nr:PREDICTED: 1-acyl-sn-glycerol-3-phosphate acyltransferase beta [Latimeria chalumnae]|eukprot:XP_005987493.2 PREDICTED: 1-acyl-sn-glycerol-3-phosphate acyltransferase beta [Latimeria chalumnae]
MAFLWMVVLFLLLLFPVLMVWSSCFKYYFKIIFYNAWVLCLATVAIPLCLLKSRGRSVENMRLLQCLLWHIKYMYGLKLEVTGLEHFQVKGPFVVISNHQSSLDLMGMMEVLPERCVQIAKKELLYAGSLGVACWLGGIIFIDRKSISDAKSVMAEAAQTMVKDNVRVWVFPEGTRNADGDILPFKKGAFHLAVQAQVSSVHGKVTIRILSKIETKGLTAENVSELTERCQTIIKTTFLEISNGTNKAEERWPPQ